MKRRLALFVAALFVAAPAVVMLQSTQAGATIEFGFTEHPTNAEFVINGQKTLQPTAPPGPGDVIVFREDLLQGSTNIGYDNGTCTVTFNNNAFCVAVFAFTNKGDITVTALLRNGAMEGQPAVFDAAVTGGTFAYRNAHGDGHAVNQPNGDTAWTLNLVTQ
jgi:hypothetical protein